MKDDFAIETPIKNTLYSANGTVERGHSVNIVRMEDRVIMQAENAEELFRFLWDLQEIARAGVSFVMKKYGVSINVSGKEETWSA